MSSARVLVVGGGPFQIDIVNAVRAVGAESVVVDRDADAVAMALADQPVAVDVLDLPAVVRVARDAGVDAVVTAASDVAVYGVSAVVDALGLRGLSTEVARRCRDKLATYAAVAAAGLPMPKTLRVDSAAEAEARVDEVGGVPLVVKPRSSAGGRGVSIVDTIEGLPAAFERACRYDSGGDGVLLQAHVGGESIGVEAIFVDGEVTRALVLEDQYRPDFVSPVGHALPSRATDAVREAAVQGAADFARAVGLTDGPANFDLRRDDDEIVLIELNPRLGGSSITELARCGLGVDLSRATVSMALGRDPGDALRPRRTQPCASRLLLHAGPIRAVDAAVAARWSARDDVEWLKLDVAAGRTPSVDQWSLFGRCLVRGDTVAGAIATAAALADELEASAR